ncbi:hypothetical protein Anas_06460, partial [Armadillidium nasatum]
SLKCQPRQCRRVSRRVNMFSTQSSRKVLIILVLNILQVFCLPQLQEPQTNALAGDNFVCPEDFGDFEDPLQCDKYWRCDQGVATPHLCDDGLVFDKFKADGREDPCDSPYVVDCAKRVKLQEPTFPSEICPRRHGFFADPDITICDVFYTCKNGRHTKTPCSPGLHFDEKTGTCAWPNIANRTGCGKKKQASVNGFVCPVEEVLNDQGMTIPHPSYPNEVDCQKFYVLSIGTRVTQGSIFFTTTQMEMVLKTLAIGEILPKLPSINNWVL